MRELWRGILEPKKGCRRGKDVPVDEFVEYGTLFKLEHPSETTVCTLVYCLNCGAPFPLSDLMEGELEENVCPSCKMTAAEYFQGKPHRRVPRNA